MHIQYKERDSRVKKSGQKKNHIQKNKMKPWAISGFKMHA